MSILLVTGIDGAANCADAIGMQLEMEVVAADNGRDAITILQDQPDIDIVLMDIMMPEMDGIDTMREIRKIPQLKSLPIVAVL